MTAHIRLSQAELDALITERIALGKLLDPSFPRGDFDTMHALITRVYFMTPEEKETFIDDSPTVSLRAVFDYLHRTCVWGPAATFKTIHNFVAKPHTLDAKKMRTQLLDAMDTCSIAHHPIVTDQKFRKALEEQAEAEQIEIVRRDNLNVFQRMLGKMRK